MNLSALAPLAGPLLGGLLGFLYHRLVGCASGACPITANPVTATLYGVLLGVALQGSRP